MNPTNPSAGTGSPSARPLSPPPACSPPAAAAQAAPAPTPPPDHHRPCLERTSGAPRRRQPDHQHLHRRGAEHRLRARREQRRPGTGKDASRPPRNHPHQHRHRRARRVRGLLHLHRPDDERHRELLPRTPRRLHHPRRRKPHRPLRQHRAHPTTSPSTSSASTTPTPTPSTSPSPSAPPASRSNPRPSPRTKVAPKSPIDKTRHRHDEHSAAASRARPDTDDVANRSGGSRFMAPNRRYGHHSMWLRLLVIALAVVAVSWSVMIVLAKRLPPGLAKDLATVLPACVTTARRLRRDQRVPRRVKVALLIAAV